MTMKTFRHNRLSGNPRGMSLIEMVFALAIMSLTLTFATLATILIARESVRSLVVLPAENRTQIVMDKIRFTLQQARFGTVVVSNNNQRIEFLNPFVSASSKSAIFVENGHVFYQPDISNSARQDWRAVKTLAFATQNAGALVSIQMTMPARYRGTDILVSGRDLVYVRN
jgi:prepilin-type N-terminal cleavage/methylation domain-containing protein